MFEVGKIIKNSRKSQNITQAEISSNLKISKDFIHKLENDSLDKDYNLIFYIGHVRSICEYLNLDYTIVENFKKQYSFKKTDISQIVSKPDFKNSKELIKFLPYSFIFVIILSFYGLFIYENDNDLEYSLVPDLPENLEPVIEKANLESTIRPLTEKNINKDTLFEDFTSSSVIASTKIQNKDESNYQITLKFLDQTWFQIRDTNDDIIISQLMEKNEEYTYFENDIFSVTAGNAGNILVSIDNNVVGKIGKTGEVVDSLIIDKNFKN